MGFHWDLIGICEQPCGGGATNVPRLRIIPGHEDGGGHQQVIKVRYRTVQW